MRRAEVVKFKRGSDRRGSLSLTSSAFEFATGRTLVRKPRLVESNSVRAAAIAAVVVATVSICCTLVPSLALAASASEIDRNATQALKLFTNNTSNEGAHRHSEGHPYLPEHRPGGFLSWPANMVTVRCAAGGKTIGYYRSVSGSAGFQCAQLFG